MDITHSTSHKRKNVTRTLALFLVGLGLLILGGAGLVLLPRAVRETGEPASAIPARVNYPAPDLQLADLSGAAVSLEGLRGQIVLVNNWATWCPPCRAEMPALQAYYEAHREQGFVVIAIDAGETLAEVQRFVEGYGLSFPVWLDREQKALVAFRNLTLPSSYVIDREGTVRLAWSGPVTQETLEKYVTPLIRE
jgi:peroxiredoxin